MPSRVPPGYWSSLLTNRAATVRERTFLPSALTNRLLTRAARIKLDQYPLRKRREANPATNATELTRFDLRHRFLA